MMPFSDMIVAIFRGLCPKQITKIFDKNPTESRQVAAAHKYEYRKLVQIPISQPREDHISGLPDEILSYILSHLTLRDAVRMTTLSRRWSNLRLPYLDLDWCVLSGSKTLFHWKECERYKQKFIESVDQVLRLYKDINVTKFRFSFCYNKRYSTDVDKWINFAADKGLESLTLQFICVDHEFSLRNLERDELYVICTSFLTRFRDLRNLRLDSCILKINDDFRFNRLVKLDLNYVALDGTQLQRLLSEASSIEWLRLRSCNLPEKFCVGNDLLSLKFLVIDSCSDVREIEINSRNLKTLEFSGKVAVKFSSVNAPRLENVYVYPDEMETYGAVHFLENLARRFSGVVTLLLQATYSVIQKLPTRPGTLFQSVLRLDLFINDGSINVNVGKVIPNVLKAFPSLQELSVQLSTLSPYIIAHGDPEEPPIIDNFHVNLKEVELGGFERNWIFFARYLLRSCLFLDQMVIHRTSKVYMGCGSWLKRDQQRFTTRHLEIISAALQRKAVSPAARLIIRDVDSSDHLY